MKSQNLQNLSLTYLSIAFALLLSCTNIQDKNQHKEKTKDQHKEKEALAKSFLAYYQKEILKSQTKVLLEDTFDYDYTSCLYTFKLDTAYKKFEELDIINGQKKKWNKQNMPNYQLISTADLPETQTPEGWKNFRKKYGGYYTFSYPIASNDLKYVVFYASFYCGDRCGEGKFGLFEKTKTGWKLVKYYCNWIA